MGVQLKETIREIENILRLRYPNAWLDGERIFRCGDQRFIVSGFQINGQDVVVVEYGDKDTPRTQYEDGDVYVVLEMSIDDIAKEIVREVEDADESTSI